MSRVALCSSAVTVLAAGSALLTAGSALAYAPPPPTAEPKLIEFGVDNVAVDRDNPLSLISVMPVGGRDSLIRIRVSYVPEIVRSTDAL